MNAKELRQKYIQFFESKGHLLHDSAPLIPMDATGKLDESLLFTGAGMVQFKPYFRGIAKPPHTRLVDSQKCVRAVDIENVGNPSHLTFFEMLGNFSFGDYFKKEAIDYAWEFLSSNEWLGLDMSKICVTVYEEDDEAFSYWAEHWEKAGFNPVNKIHRLGEDKNYWPAGAYSAGPPGPCGPCSEIFFQTVPDEIMIGDYKADDDAGHWLEIWNLVFMQFEWKGELIDAEKPHQGYKKLGMELLPKPCIDTGSGLERTATVLGGFESVYETDVISPIVNRISELAKYPFGTDEQKDRAVRVIADHMRTSSFCIADGILPGNSGRGYVLRRLIRRSILKGERILGFRELFLAELFPSVVSALGDPYKELLDRKELVQNTLRNEEGLFRRTVSDGVNQFQAICEENKFESEFPGKLAFYLYDTFGFPLEVTEELSEEIGLIVNREEFHAAMKEAQKRSRNAMGASELFSDKEDLVLAIANNANDSTEFVGYDFHSIECNLVEISPRFDSNGLSTGDFQICLDKTPFYAESGGQVGDTGKIYCETFQFVVSNTWKELGLIWHDAKLVSFSNDQAGLREQTLKGLSADQIAPILHSGKFFKPIKAEIDLNRRRDIVRNHTATHLLHAALRHVLGTHVTQAGSLVARDRLRFDFTHTSPLAADEIQQVEDLVNQKIADAQSVRIHNNVPIDEARKLGAMMLFGEKYGDRVRVVDLAPFSLELCGGCHVDNSSEIGIFKIVSETSSASGVRRIEAVTGIGAYEWFKERERLLMETSQCLKSNINELPKTAKRLQDNLKELKKERDTLLQSGSGSGPEIVSVSVKGVNLFVQKVTVGGAEAAKLAADKIVERDSNAVAFIGLKEQDKILFISKVGADAVNKGAHAGNLVREVSKLTGGGGGGSAGFAQAGGKEVAKFDSALNQVQTVLESQLS